MALEQIIFLFILICERVGWSDEDDSILVEDG